MITRRSLLLSSTILFSSLSYASTQLPQTVDVAVIGAGGAGCCAACSAKQEGARDVAIFEKAPIAGGHTAVSTGTVSAVWPRLQNPLGIIDSPELMTEHMLQVGKVNNPDLVRTLSEHSGEALEWMESLGVRWRSEVSELHAGKHIRAYRTFNPRSGYDFVVNPLRVFQKLGGKIFYKSTVIDIAPQESGFVLTVKQNNAIHRVFARKVIIASGGFTENPKMREKYAPGLTTNFPSSCQSSGILFDGCTGEMIECAGNLGAKLVDMDSIQCIPFVGGRTMLELGSDIFINAQGKRFVQEGRSWMELTQAVRALPENYFWVITGMHGRQTMDVELKLLHKKINVAQSVKEISDITDIPSDVLKVTLDDYNSAVRGEIADPVGISRRAKLIDRPPFFVGKERLCVHTTLGGIAIDSKSRVLNVTGSVMDGLFACGEATGGIHGIDKMAGTSMTENFVFGRIAGQQAAATL